MVTSTEESGNLSLEMREMKNVLEPRFHCGAEKCGQRQLKISKSPLKKGTTLVVYLNCLSPNK